MNDVLAFLSNILTPDFGYSVLRVTTPILFAALAAVICERAGVVNIALEGIMLTAALFGVIGSAFTQNLLAGLLFAIIGGMLISAALAYFALYLKTDIILSGIALNMMTVGGTIFLLSVVSGDKGTSTSLRSLVFPRVDIPLIEQIPVLGPILSGHNVLTYVAMLMVFLVFVLLYKTRLGLRIRAVGENKDAAASVGINVKRIQFIALLIGGAVASLGGAYMSMGYLSNFSKNMVAGRGFIALAAEAMGQATPLGTFFASLLFGFAEAFSYTMQSLSIPSEFVRMVPYLATVVGLVIYAQAKLMQKKKKLKNK